METGRMNQLLDDIRRDVDQIESPVSQAMSDEYVVRLAQTLAANVRALHVAIIECGELPDEWDAGPSRRRPGPGPRQESSRERNERWRRRQ